MRDKECGTISYILTQRVKKGDNEADVMCYGLDARLDEGTNLMSFDDISTRKEDVAYLIELFSCNKMQPEYLREALEKFVDFLHIA